ncbi:MAG: hypothetical protein ACK5IB_00410 [Qingshengfaniella sp.]
MFRMIVLLSLALVAGCQPYSGAIPTSDHPALVPVAAMPQACRHAAAARYAQLEGNILMQPAVRDTSGGYSVSGTYATVNVQRTIGCRFSADGTLLGVGRV